MLFVKDKTSKFSEKKAPIYSAFGGVAQKRKEFLRLLLKRFCRTCYTLIELNNSEEFLDGRIGQSDSSDWAHQYGLLSFTKMTNNFSQKFFLYARKSTDEADRQVLSIEAQLTEVREYAQKVRESTTLKNLPP